MDARHLPERIIAEVEPIALQPLPWDILRN